MTSSKRTWLMGTLGCLLAVIGGFLFLLFYPFGRQVGEVRIGEHDFLVGEAIPLEVQLLLPWGEMPAQVALSLQSGTSLRFIGRRSALQSIGLGTWGWTVNVTLQAVQAGTFSDERLQVSFSEGQSDWAELETITVQWPDLEPGFVPMPVGALESPPFSSPLPYLVGVLVAAGVGLVLLRFTRGGHVVQVDTPLTIALSSLESCRESGEGAEVLGQAVGLHLRIYLSKRIGRNVEAMTAAELNDLQDLLPVGLLERLQELCRCIDQIKYAPKDQECDLNPELLNHAIDWVTDCDAALRREDGNGV